MKKINILFLILLSTINSYSQKNISILDGNNLPLENTLIYNESKLVFKTNSKGEFYCTKNYMDKKLNVTKLVVWFLFGVFTSEFRLSMYKNLYSIAG